MKQINSIIAGSITLLISIILFLVSGITKEHILMPMTMSMDTLNEINFVFLFGSIIFFTLSLAVLSVFSLKSEKFDVLTLIIPVIGSVLILVFSEISLMTLFLCLALIIGTMVLGRSVISEKEEYKKLSAYKISTHGASKMLLIISIFIALTVYIQLESDTSYAENTTENLLKTTTGFTRENLTNIDAAIKEQQRIASYAYIDALKDTYVETLETTGDLTEDQRKLCTDSFQNDLGEFDRKSK
ncbi:MAG: hypothetical protein KAS12_07125, partial [Candidatus Aenigmarchaeota archaeon]|nr:hypothetical protein [Candidatus Aenigmarchaeota archaeon]